MANNFKVGDKVRFVRQGCSARFNLGEILEVVSCVSDSYVCKRISDELCQRVVSAQIELVERNPAVEYKVGDIVKIVRKIEGAFAPHWAPSMDDTLGCVGVVEEVRRPPFGQPLRFGVRVNDELWIYAADSLEPYEEHKASTRLFAKGRPSAFGFCRPDSDSSTGTPLPLIETHKLLTDIKLD